MNISQVPLFDQIKQYCHALEQSFQAIPKEREQLLLPIADYLADQYQQGKTPQLTVICTHNSRRSHLGQIWLAVSAHYFQLPEVRTYSGGTEATAFHPNAVAALQRVGFVIVPQSPVSNHLNPVYEVRWSSSVGDAQHCFSKKYDAPTNPTHHFAAIMVCTDADENCPVVFGAEARFSLPFEDPKVADNTDQANLRYDICSQQIAREALFIFSRLKTHFA